MCLVFSTAKDGFSLNTLYRKTADVLGTNLLLIRDYTGSVFGALLSERMHSSQHFYGTGESCVFHWKNGFKVCLLVTLVSTNSIYTQVVAWIADWGVTLAAPCGRCLLTPLTKL